jgi:prepilin-type N-terminal cleavage/methylation domain-containing protein
MRRRGFTLIEILVVISIIILLAATLCVAIRAAIRQTMIIATKGTLAKLVTAATVYAADYNNAYPLSHQTVAGTDDCIVGRGAGIQALASCLFSNPGLGTARPPDKPDHYLEPYDIGKGQLVFKADGTVDHVTDAWGIPLYYYRPGAPMRCPEAFDLFSAGPDQKTITEIPRSSGPDYKYRDEVPVVFTPGDGSHSAGGATGDARDLLGSDPAAAQDINDAADDLTNWRMAPLR